MISSPRSASLIGGEAIDLIHSSREHITWLTALLNAVSADVTHGKVLDLKKVKFCYVAGAYQIGRYPLWYPRFGADPRRTPRAVTISGDHYWLVNCSSKTTRGNTP